MGIRSVFFVLLGAGAIASLTFAVVPDAHDRVASWIGGPQQSAASGPAGRSAPVAVTVAEARVQPFRERLIATGAVRSWDSVLLSTEVAGRVEEMLFEDGDVVEAGRPLIRLESRMETAELARARALLTEAEAALIRAAELQDRNVAAAATLETARAARDTARAVFAQAEIALDRRVIVAPFSGVLSRREVSPGAYVEPGDTLTRLDTLGRVKADLFVPAQALGVLDRGQSIEARTVAVADKTFEGTILDLQTELDPITRQVVITAGFDDPDNQLFRGLELFAEVILAERRAIRLPETALISLGPTAFVFAVLDDDTVVRQRVTIGARRDGFVVIEDGIEPGTRVVVEGAEKLDDGRKISAVTPENSPIRHLLEGENG